jgi:hypothetical protein
MKTVEVGQDVILRTDCQSVQPGAARPGRVSNLSHSAKRLSRDRKETVRRAGL